MIPFPTEFRWNPAVRRHRPAGRAARPGCYQLSKGNGIIPLPNIPLPSLPKIGSRGRQRNVRQKNGNKVGSHFPLRSGGIRRCGRASRLLPVVREKWYDIARWLAERFSLTLNPSPAGRGRQPSALTEIRMRLRRVPPPVLPSSSERFSLSAFCGVGGAKGGAATANMAGEVCVPPSLGSGEDCFSFPASYNFYGNALNAAPMATAAFSLPDG